MLFTGVDTLGFGDVVDNGNFWQPGIDYIDSQSEDYPNEDFQGSRHPVPESGVQCWLYFIFLSEHGLKPLHIEFIKHLHEKQMLNKLNKLN